jgi:hypothetical protein
MAKKKKLKTYDVMFQFGGIMTVKARNSEIAVNKVQRMSKKTLMEKSKFFRPENYNQWEVDRD